MGLFDTFFSVPVPSRCERVEYPGWEDIDVWIKRDDQLHTTVSGNKFRKLKYNLLPIENPGILLSMGGPYSNHLHALAYAAREGACPCFAFVRGEPGEMRSPTLRDCMDWGMSLLFVSRTQFRQLRSDADYWRVLWREWHGNSLDPILWLPEGGSNRMAMRGVAELVDELPFKPDHIISACGSGATLAGLALGMAGSGRTTGVAVLKGADYLRDQVRAMLLHYPASSESSFELLTGYHDGGYGRASTELLKFCREFSLKTGIPVEPVYTGKVCRALKSLIDSGHFLRGERIVLLHTGGLQGARGHNLAL